MYVLIQTSLASSLLHFYRHGRVYVCAGSTIIIVSWYDARSSIITNGFQRWQAKITDFGLSMKRKVRLLQLYLRCFNLHLNLHDAEGALYLKYLYWAAGSQYALLDSTRDSDRRLFQQCFWCLQVFVFVFCVCARESLCVCVCVCTWVRARGTYASKGAPRCNFFLDQSLVLSSIFSCFC